MPHPARNILVFTVPGSRLWTVSRPRSRSAYAHACITFSNLLSEYALWALYGVLWFTARVWYASRSTQLAADIEATWIIFPLAIGCEDVCLVGELEAIVGHDRLFTKDARVVDDRAESLAGVMTIEDVRTHSFDLIKLAEVGKICFQLNAAARRLDEFLGPLYSHGVPAVNEDFGKLSARGQLSGRVKPDAVRGPGDECDRHGTEKPWNRGFTFRKSKAFITRGGLRKKEIQHRRVQRIEIIRGHVSSHQIQAHPGSQPADHRQGARQSRRPGCSRRPGGP